MSFSLTTAQIKARTKTVTRRLGWKNLKPGTLIQACRQCQGIKPGELERLTVIRIKAVSREPLNALIGGSYTDRMAKYEVIAEGFPDLSAREFVKMFSQHMKCEPGTLVTRIEFEYVEKECPVAKTPGRKQPGTREQPDFQGKENHRAKNQTI